MTSPDGLRLYRRITFFSALVLTSLLFYLASRYFSVGALLVGMLIPVTFGLAYLLIWRLLAPKNAYGYVEERARPGETTPNE